MIIRYCTSFAHSTKLCYYLFISRISHFVAFHLHKNFAIAYGVCGMHKAVSLMGDKRKALKKIIMNKPVVLYYLF